MRKARCLLAELLIDAGSTLTALGNQILPPPSYGVESVSNAEAEAMFGVVDELHAHGEGTR